MSRLTVEKIVARVQRQFGDESGVQVTTEDIHTWIEDSIREATMQHENLLQVPTLIDSVADLGTYDLPDDCLSIQNVSFKTDAAIYASYYALRFISVKELDERFDGWFGPDIPSGTPRYFFRGPNVNTFSIFPRPNISLTYAIKLIYSRGGVAFDPLDPLDIPEYYHQYVLEYCLMKAYEMDEDWEAADKKAMYVQSTLDFNNARESWFGQDTYPSITTTSEDYI